LTWKKVLQELALCNTEPRYSPFLQFNHVFVRYNVKLDFE